MATEKLVARVGADISGFKSGMSGMVGEAKKAANHLKWAFIGMGASFAGVAWQGANFEQMMKDVGAVAQASTKELADMEKTARRLGATTQFTATEAAGGMNELAQAGMNAKQTIDAIEYSLKLAGATNVSVAQATHLVASSLNQFSLNANQAKRVTDTYTQAANKSLATIDKLTEGMKFSGVAGKAFNWTIEETTAALVGFVDLGLEGGMAGRHLNAAMNHLVKGTGEVQQTLRDLGLTLEDINPSTHSFGQILETLGKTAIYDKQALALFGAEAGMQMLSLIDKARLGQYNFEQFTQMLIRGQQGVGRTVEMYNEKMDTFKNAWKNMLGAIEELGLTFFDTFKMQGKNIFQFLEDKINNISGWVRSQSPAFKSFFSSIEKSVKGIAERMEQWVVNNREFITQGIPNFIEKVGKKLEWVAGIWGALPDDLVGPMGTGIIVRMLTGSTSIAAYVAGVHALLNLFDTLTEKMVKAETERREAREKKYGTGASGGFLDVLGFEEGEGGKRIPTEVENQINFLYKSLGQKAGDAIDEYEAALKMKWQLMSQEAGIWGPEDPEGMITLEDVGLSLEYIRKQNQETMKQLTVDFNQAQDIIDATNRLKEKGLDSVGITTPKGLDQTIDDFEKLKNTLANFTIPDPAEQISRWRRAIEMPTTDIDWEEGEREKNLQSLYSIEEQKWQIRQDFDLKYKELMEGQFAVQQEQLRKEVNAYWAANADKEKILTYSAKKTAEISRQQFQYTLSIISETAGRVASTFQQIAQAGGKHSKTAFAMYKAFAIAQATIDTYLSIMRIWADPNIKPFWVKYPLVGLMAATGAAQVAAIAAQKPPSYDEGGVSNTPGYYYSGVPEAHIPLKGGKIPVEMSEGAGITIIMENPVFQDLNTQRATFAAIAEVIARQVAPSAVANNYRNDGIMRSLVRSRA